MKRLILGENTIFVKIPIETPESSYEINKSVSVRDSRFKSLKVFPENIFQIRFIVIQLFLYQGMISCKILNVNCKNFGFESFPFDFLPHSSSCEIITNIMRKFAIETLGGP